MKPKRVTARAFTAFNFSRDDHGPATPVDTFKSNKRTGFHIIGNR